MQTVAQFQTTEQAHLCRLYLESKGIPSHLLDEHTVQMAWHYSDAIGGVRLVVSEQDYENACQQYQEYKKTSS